MRSKLENPFFLVALGVVGLFIGKTTMVPPPQEGSKPTHPMRSRASAEVGAAAEPAQGWWGIIKRVGSEISANQLMTQAAAVTFYALLSIFPAMAALVSVYGLVADPAIIVHQVDALGAIMPGGGQQLLTDELNTLVTSSSKGLGWALVLGVATSLWTSNQAMKAVFNALNAVHEVKEKRSFIKLTALTLACTVGVLLFMVLALAAVVIVPAVLSLVPMGAMLEEVVNWARWPLMLVAVTLLLAVLFRFGPCRSKVVWRWISWGSAFASIGWVVVSVLFSWYVANFGSYNKTYGSLGAVVGFMTWVWISTTVVLIGAQMDAELEKSTAGKQRSRASSDQAPKVVAAGSPA